MMNKNKLRCIALGLSVLSVGVAFADQTSLTKAEELLKTQDFKSAYALLEPMEAEESGNVKYDYMLGIAGMESGHVTRAIFALERVLAVEPNNVQARAMIAKAYFQAGEVENAKQEFQNVLKADTGKDFAKLIEGNLRAIDRSTGQSRAFGAYLDFGIGHDTNVNSATFNNDITFPSGTTATLTGNSVQKSSNFMSGAAGVSFRAPVFTKGFDVYGSLEGNNKFNWIRNEFDTTSIDAALGMRYRKFVDTFSAELQYNDFDVDSATFRRSYGVNARWMHDIDDKNQVGVYANTAKLEYPTSSLRDGHRHVGGVTFGHAFSGDKSPVVFTNVYAGRENTNANNLGNDIYGARLTGQLAFNYKWVGFAGAGFEKREYDGPDTTSNVDRSDKQYDMSIGVRYLPTQNWTIKPQLTYLKNESNTSLYEYDRYILSINFRKDFAW